MSEGAPQPITATDLGAAANGGAAFAESVNSVCATGGRLWGVVLGRPR